MGNLGQTSSERYITVADLINFNLISLMIMVIRRFSFIFYRVARRNSMKAGGLIYIMVDLEAHTMRTSMNDFLLKDIVLMKKMITDIANTTMTKEEVLDTREKI